MGKTISANPVPGRWRPPWVFEILRRLDMRILYWGYTVLISGVFFILLPPFLLLSMLRGRWRSHLGERLGFMPGEAARPSRGGPRIWIHAVSLGEVKVAKAIVRALNQLIPECSILISTTTEHGRNLAVELFGEAIPVVYAPLDFLVSVRKALSIIRPDVMVFLETEIWPAWIREAGRKGIRTALINGRISVRSFGGYLRLRPFFAEILGDMDLFSMIMEGDAARIRALGADPAKIKVNGNAKYDILGTLPDPAAEVKIRQLLNLTAEDRVIVAGSTRRGEEEMVLDAYVRVLERFPDTILLVAPRHIQRIPEIASMLDNRGLGYRLWTDIEQGRAKRREKIVLIDTFGELFNIYSAATAVFCGASLVPLGGQNPLEPASWGKPVLYGPSMEDFQDAKELLERSDACLPVAAAGDLGDKFIWLLDHPDEARGYGARAREVVLKNRGAAEKQALAIRDLCG